MTRIGEFIVRGTLSLVNAAKKLQTLQVRLTAGEVKDNVEHFEPYGYTSNPLPGSEIVMGFVGGDRSNAIAMVVTDRRYRKQNLKPGEVCIFTDEGDEIHFMRGKIIAITSGNEVQVTATNKIVATAPKVVMNASASITFNTPDVYATGNIKADGDITDATGSMQSMRDTYNSHDHDENDSGGPTDTPNQPMQ